MSRAHAILGPSSASKWLNCTPSARLEMQFAQGKSDAADEGTLAHSLAELILSQRANLITNKEFRRHLAIIEENAFYNRSMYEFCDGYAIYVLELLSAARARTPDAQLFVEQKLVMDDYVPEGFGTGDVGIVSDGYIEVVDFKYGKGVAVSAEDNSQLKIYALGWLREFDGLYDINTIRLHIYQPRMNNISAWELGYVKLKVWAEHELKPKAELAFKGEGEFAAGKHCQFCKAKTTCRANAEYQVRIAQLDFANIENDDEIGIMNLEGKLLTDTQVTAILSRVEAFKNWATSIADYARDMALKGKKWPGYKLVSGKSKRQLTDTVAVEKLLVKEGFDRTKLYKPQELIGITEMEKLTGKKLFDEKISKYTIKTPGAPTLVPKSDPRTEYNNAASDFDGVDDEDFM